MEEEENHGDAFHKFQAIEKKAVKAIFSSKVGKESLVVLNLSISLLDDFDQWTLVVFSFLYLILMILNLHMMILIRDF